MTGSSDYDVERAKDELAGILELDVDASWDDIVAYTAKAKGSLRMSNSAIRRRSILLAEALRMDPEHTSWPQMLQRVDQMLDSLRRLRDALLAAGVSQILIDAIERIERGVDD